MKTKICAFIVANLIIYAGYHILNIPNYNRLAQDELAVTSELAQVQSAQSQFEINESELNVTYLDASGFYWLLGKTTEHKTLDQIGMDAGIHFTINDERQSSDDFKAFEAHHSGFTTKFDARHPGFTKSDMQDMQNQLPDLISRFATLLQRRERLLLQRSAQTSDLKAKLDDIKETNDRIGTFAPVLPSKIALAYDIVHVIRTHSLPGTTELAQHQLNDLVSQLLDEVGKAS